MNYPPRSRGLHIIPTTTRLNELGWFAVGYVTFLAGALLAVWWLA